MDKSIEEIRKEFEVQRRVYGDPHYLQIKGFLPLNEELPSDKITRFTKPHNLKLPCPECGEFDDVYEDNWPPNYINSNGCLAAGSSGTSKLSTPEYPIKHICIKCKIQFLVIKFEEEEIEYKNEIKISIKYKESQRVAKIKPLHLIYNFYMTDYDYENELHYNKNGCYTFCVYG